VRSFFLIGADLSLTVSVKNDALERALAANLAPLMDKAMRKSALDLVARMKQWIQRVNFIDTGATLNSVYAREGGEAFTWVIGPTTHYAIYGEFGTRFMPARPFARPALEEARPTITAAITAAIEQAARG